MEENAARRHADSYRRVRQVPQHHQVDFDAEEEEEEEEEEEKEEKWQDRVQINVTSEMLSLAQQNTAPSQPEEIKLQTEMLVIQNMR